MRDGGQGGAARPGGFARKATQGTPAGLATKPPQPHDFQYDQDRQGMAAGGDYRSANADRRGGNDPDVLHKQLSMAMIEKDQLEQEFWRLGNQSKTKQEI